MTSGNNATMNKQNAVLEIKRIRRKSFLHAYTASMSILDECCRNKETLDQIREILRREITLFHKF